MIGQGEQAIDRDGWLINARHRPSPNRDARSQGMAVSALIIHGMTVPPGQFGHDHIVALFTNTLPRTGHAVFEALADVRVSAHVVIERIGRLTQYVGFDERAWHAGRSSLFGREAVNDFSIGIELEGADTCAYTPAQYRVLARVTRALMRRYPAIDAARIVGHSDIAPSRKTDPGPAFDWALFTRLREASCT